MSVTAPPRPASADTRRSADLLARCIAPAEDPDSAIQRALRLLQDNGGLRGLLGGAGPVSAVPARWQERLQMQRALWQCLRDERPGRGQALTSPADTLDYLRDRLRDRQREVFCGLFLDTRHRVLHCEDLFLGSIDGACVYPRVVAERALRHGAAAVIVAHNHPSGVAEPSLADQAITRRLKEALALLEIRLLDHFVIGEGQPVSLASRGLL